MPLISPLQVHMQENEKQGQRYLYVPLTLLGAGHTSLFNLHCSCVRKTAFYIEGIDLVDFDSIDNASAKTMLFVFISFCPSPMVSYWDVFKKKTKNKNTHKLAIIHIWDKKILLITRRNCVRSKSQNLKDWFSSCGTFARTGKALPETWTVI